MELKAKTSWGLRHVSGSVQSDSQVSSQSNKKPKISDPDPVQFKNEANEESSKPDPAENEAMIK